MKKCECGHECEDVYAFCPKCGAKLKDEVVAETTIENNTMYCKFCGNKIHSNAEICPHCGCRVNERKFQVHENSNEISACSVLALIFGLLGGFLGIIFGIVGVTNAKNKTDRNCAIAGIFFFFLWVLIFILLIAVNG